MNSATETNVRFGPFACPVCHGTSKVSFPPDWPGDIPLNSEAKVGGYQCPACVNTPGIVWGPVEMKVDPAKFKP